MRALQRTWRFLGVRFQVHILPRFRVRLWIDSGAYKTRRPGRRWRDDG